MNDLIKEGKKKTILVSISMLLVSLHTIYFYNTVVTEIESAKLIKQLVRFILTIGLLIWAYKGMKWAKNLLIVLLILAILGAVIAFVTLNVVFINKLPLLVMVCVYAITLYHFWFSKSYKAFFEYQNRDKETP